MTIDIHRSDLRYLEMRRSADWYIDAHGKADCVHGSGPAH